MSEWTEAKVEPERDRYGRYLITPAGGGKPRSYTRATTIAETLDDRYNLEAWKQRMVALGLAQRPDLYASVASLPADDKQALNRLCDQAREAAAGSAGANLGTALHRFTERINRGEDVKVPAPWDADIEAYKQALNGGGYAINPDYIERTVVLEELGIAGTFDLVLAKAFDDNGNTLPEFDSYIADLKTGATLDFSWGAIAVQLALYAHADSIYDHATKTHAAMPCHNMEKALVIHLPAGKATCTLYEVDITAGWEAAQQALWVRNWRKRRNLASPIAGVVPEPTTAKGSTSTPASIVGGGESAPASPPVEPAPPAGTARREALIARVKALTPEHLAELAERWPTGVPTFKASDAHTDAQLDAVDKVLTSIDWHPEPVDTPEPAQREEAPAPAPVWTVEEGDDLGAAEVDAIKLLVDTLDPSLLSQINQWAKEAHAADRTFSLKAERHRTQRRFEIMRAAVALSPYPDDVVRAAISYVMTTTYGDELQPAFTVGQALGSLTIAEASRLAALAEDLGQGTAIVYTDDGVDFVAVAA